LLDHWAAKSEPFAKFHAAYVTEKAVQEITVDCVDFYLGIVPYRFTAILAANKAYKDRMEQAQLREMRDRQAGFDEYDRLIQQERNKQEQYKIRGKRADFVVLDDPYENIMNQQRSALAQQANNYMKQAMMQAQNDYANKMAQMQRLQNSSSSLLGTVDYNGKHF